MQSKNELKEIYLRSRTCYYFDDNNCGNILLDKKSYKTYDEIRSLIILDHSWFDKICDKINISYK